MRVVQSSALAVLLLMSTACEQRAPLGQGEVAGIADHLQLREHLNWGDPIEVLPPARSDADGHLWWQARYANGPDGSSRIIIVDDESGWSRLPPPGYVARSKPLGKPSAAVPVVAAEGPFVLLLTPSQEEDDQGRLVLEREVVRLNALAGSNGLIPLFSLRHGHDNQVSIVYGWQGDQGIAKDPRVVEWIALRTPYHDTHWVDLTQP
jgi:hypothetical protein